MQKKESTALYVLRLTVTLLLITGIMAALLAFINQMTKDRIAAIQAEKTQKAIELVLPGAANAQALETLPQGAAATVKKVYTAAMGDLEGGSDSDNWYAVEVAPVGFDGEITMMVGIDHTGKVLGVRIISHTETAGLGAVAAADNAKGEAFRGQFVGKDAAVAVGADIDALTGATITSKAVTQGINDAVAAAQLLLQ